MRSKMRFGWLALALVALLAGCSNPVQKALESDHLYIKDEVVGQGEPVQTGDFVRINYVGWLYQDGKQGAEFDRSHDEPFDFQVGRGMTIKGWDEGVIGMKVGGKRTLIIGPELAYGDRELPQIPANSTLKFSVELVSVPRVKITDITTGEGPEVTAGDFVKVNYTGWLDKDGQKGEQFDSTYDRNEPFSFKVGGGMVIKGLDRGVLGMKVGGKRDLVVPPELGYGERGSNNIPENATLHYEIEVVALPRVGIKILKEGQGREAKVDDIIQVHYTGYLQGPDGKKGDKFDSSRDRNRPFSFKLGQSKVIPGWEIGLRGTKVGEIRELTVPPDLAYGNRGIHVGPKEVIPPGATLIFDVETLDIKSP